MINVRDVLVLPGLLLSEAVTLRVLHALAALPGLGGPHLHPGGWQGWLGATPPEDAVASVARLLALGLVWWLLLSTLLAVVAGVVRWRPARAAAAMLSTRAVRQIVDRGLAGVLAVTVAVGPATVARASPGDGFFTAAGPLAAASEEPADGAPLLPPVWEARSPAAPQQRAAPQPARQDAARPAAHHTIDAGQHLWWLAEHTVRAQKLEASTAEVAAYWRRLVAANVDGIRSGDPDLVFPGERIIVPPWSAWAASSAEDAGD